MLNSSLKDLHPDLVRVQAGGAKLYAARYPKGPKLSVNETSRSQAIQDAYFSVTREPVAKVKELYAAAGLYAIGDKEAAGPKKTNAKYGQSSHNFKPSRAFDSKLVDAKGNYVGDEAAYKLVAECMRDAAIVLDVKITLGGTWGDWPHVELTDWRTLK